MARKAVNMKYKATIEWHIGPATIMEVEADSRSKALYWIYKERFSNMPFKLFLKIFSNDISIVRIKEGEDGKI